tara:strand:- start:19899 stop:20834 length:936 start_codon:yes stop_codon:yes gene_type:complete
MQDRILKCWLPVAMLLVLFLLMGARESDPVLARVQQMNDQQKRQLLEKKKLFEGLEETEQQHLRELHKQLHDAPDHDALVDVMKQYSQWIRSLPSGQRVGLLSMPVVERVEAIKQIQLEQQERQLRELSGSQLGLEDSRVISLWLNKLLEKYGKEIKESEERMLSQMSSTQARWMSRMPGSPQKDRILAASLINQVSRSEDPFRTTIPVREELAKLVGQLSERSQEIYEALQGEESRRQTLARWTYVAALRSLRLVSEEELVRFYLEDVSPEDREDLDHFSGDRFRRALNDYYLRDKGIRSPFGRRAGNQQ